MIPAGGSEPDPGDNPTPDPGDNPTPDPGDNPTPDSGDDPTPDPGIDPAQMGVDGTAVGKGASAAAADKVRITVKKRHNRKPATCTKTPCKFLYFYHDRYYHNMLIKIP